MIEVQPFDSLWFATSNEALPTRFYVRVGICLNDPKILLDDDVVRIVDILKASENMYRLHSHSGNGITSSIQHVVSNIFKHVLAAEANVSPK